MHTAPLGLGRHSDSPSSAGREYVLCLLSSADKGMPGLRAQQQSGEVEQVSPPVALLRQAGLGALRANAGIPMQAGSACSACLVGQAGTSWA